MSIELSRVENVLSFDLLDLLSSREDDIYFVCSCCWTMLCSRGAIYRLFFILCVFLLSYLFASQLNVTRVIGEARVLISKSLSSETTQPASTTTSKTTQTTVTTATTATTSTTKILNTNQSTNYTDQPKEGFVTFSNNEPNYLALLKVLLDSVHAFSTRPIIAFGIDVDLNVDVKEYPRLIKRKIAQSDCGPVIALRFDRDVSICVILVSLFL